MLHIVEGEREKVLKESEKILENLRAQDPGLNITRFEEEIDINQIKDIAESQSLFGNLSVAVIEENEDIAEALEEIREGLESSQNVFIIRRTELALAKKPEFNIFSFTDAIGARKKRDAWVIYQKALASGMVAEELFYKAVWQVKSMLLAVRMPNAAAAGLNPFVYQKAKGFAGNFKSGELEKMSETLVTSYHQARRGEFEVETFLEKLILSL